ncbi:MAG TPA: hypothetical protein VMU95_12920 [Trebonia sp.]|nr:hypothetical protein [Trebonia sp.]
MSAGVLPGVVSADAATVTGVWQSPEQVPGMANLNVGAEAHVNGVSCSAPGECTAAGFYTDGAKHIQAFVVDERGGVWGAAQEVPGSAALNAGGNLVPNAISCASPGNCAIGGNYSDGSGHVQAWVADETAGVWGDAQELPGTATLNAGGNAAVTSISCAEPGYCAAGGTYSAAGTGGPVTDVFVASEAHGTWLDALEVAGTDATNASLTSVSCGSAGDCVAGGSTGANAYTVTETSGTWDSAQLVPGIAALPGFLPQVTSVSCNSSGCDAVGTTGAFNGVGFGVTETGGTWGGPWGNAEALPLPAEVPSGDFGSLVPAALSCSSPGNCTAVGDYAIITSGLAGVDQEGVIASEVGGTWGTPQTVPSLVALDSDGTGSIPSVSCPSLGDCAAVGLYGNDFGMHAAVLSESDGTWGTAQPLSTAAGQAVGQSISCGAVAYCSVGGGYSADGQQYQPIVANETPTAASYTPVAPVRVLDTRDGTGGFSSPVGAGKTIALQVAGQDGVPAYGVTAVVLNLTATGPTASGWVVAYPDGKARPAQGSSVNFTKGETIPNLVTVPVGSDGKVDLYNSAGSVNLVADLQGYYSATGTSQYAADGPVRVLDTRNDTGGFASPVGAGQSIALQVTGQDGVPATGVTAVVLNLTATGPTASSYVTAYPDGTARPAQGSNLNFTKGETIPNLVIVQVGSDGKVDLYNNAGTVNLVADLQGYYSATGGAGYAADGPVRVLDTRNDTGGFASPVGAGKAIALQVTGKDGVPASGVTAVVLNLTATGPTASGWVVAYPDGTARPAQGSNLNFTKGETIPNLVIVPVGADGKIDLYNAAGSVNLVADLQGYFAG